LRYGAFALVLMLHGLALLTTLLIGGALADRYSRPRRTSSRSARR
jgi:predicted MFS family arabinose efflux permease